MHSIDFKVKRGASDLGVRGGTIHHNGDWWGDVIIVLNDGKEGGRSYEVRLPGAAIMTAAAHIISSALAIEAQDMGDRIYKKIMSGTL